ncbi:hypothetical protein MYAM1_001849 [Malassezia yamatoensis]|uniref:Transcription initiation factor TFIID subunit 8 n=1 Tax=Malassezia yamatoensis TaxID=253288 RepID=A0AAJ5YUT9_9BASI|nr:hypothetical protein MYAM1_001849 [Malassezia yamatoensis]
MKGVATYQPAADAPAEMEMRDAEFAIHELIAQISRSQGFKGARTGAVRRFTELIDDSRSAMQLAMQSNRQSPTVHDMLTTLEYLDLEPESLRIYAQNSRELQSVRKPIRLPKACKATAPWADPTGSFLPSDDEQQDKSDKAEKPVWDLLMNEVVPNHLPSQPPRHCWMATPVYTTQTLSEMPMVQLVNRKLDNARLVESSLRRLIRETDKAALPSLNQEEAMVLEHEELGASESNNAASEEVQETKSASDTNIPADQPSKDPSVDQPTPVPDQSEGLADARDPPTYELPKQLESNTSRKLIDDPALLLISQKPSLHTVDYKLSWYSSLASNDSRLPSANLYTARLRGAADDGQLPKRPRRYIV